MLGKLFLPGIFALGFFLYTHQPTRSHVASAYVSQACDAASRGGVSAAFAWPPPGAGAEQTWLDLGLDPGFGLGWYQGHGPLPPSQNTFSIDGLAAGVKYYYRVNTQSGAKWAVSAKGSFMAGCPAAAAVVSATAAAATPISGAPAAAEAAAE